MVKQHVFQAGEGKFRITILVTITEDGLVVQIFGGERPHVGAMVLSIPRPGLDNPEKVSCNTIVVPLLGHKDDEIAKPAAEQIAKAFGRPVALVAGIHVDNAIIDDIKMLTQNCTEAVQTLIKELPIKD